MPAVDRDFHPLCMADFVALRRFADLDATGLPLES